MFRIASWVISVIISVLSVLAALLSFLPRVGVILSDPADPNTPFSSSVTITNTGYIPLDAVVPFFAVGEIATTGATHDPNFTPNYKGARITRVDWGFPRDMAIDERFGFALNDIWDTAPRGLEYADIAIVVQYEIPIVHYKQEKIFPFIAQRQTNGNFYWYPKLLKNPN